MERSRPGCAPEPGPRPAAAWPHPSTSTGVCLMSAHLRSLRSRFSRLALELLEARLAPATVTWVGGSGNWSTVANWSDGTVNRLPGPADDAVINTTGITVTHSSGSDTVKSVTSNAAIKLTGGTLTVNGTFQETGATLALLGGTLANAVLTSDTPVAGSDVPIGGGFGSLLTGSTLDGVTLNADLDVPGGGGRNAFVVIRNGLTLNGTITLRDAFLGNPAIAFLLFDSSETLSGTGTVHFPNNSPNNGVWLPNANTTLTIAPGFTVDG